VVGHGHGLWEIPGCPNIKETAYFKDVAQILFNFYRFSYFSGKYEFTGTGIYCIVPKRSVLFALSVFAGKTVGGILKPR